MSRLSFYGAPVVAAGLLLQVHVWAAGAPKVPEKVDKALRARVNEFFQYHVDGSFRKAMDIVADDTKEEYFASGKMRLKSFTLDDIKYDDKFNKAVVTTTVVRDWEFRLQVNTVTLPMTTTWRLEKGKWVWYHDLTGAWLTPMGASDYAAIKRNPDGTITLPKINADTVMAEGQKIMKVSGPDKSEVRFISGKPGSDKVTFRNGAPGSIRLEMLQMPPIPGLAYKFDKMDLGAGESSVLTVEYQPQDGQQMPRETKILFDVVPFNATNTITVHFDPPQPE